MPARRNGPVSSNVRPHTNHLAARILTQIRKTMKRLFIILTIYLAGCANPGVVQISPDTYLISREDHAGIFGSSSSLKAGVISDANAYASSMGKVAIPITTHETPIGIMGKWAKFEYQFRVVDKSDPEAKRTAIMPRADVVIERTDNINASVRSKDETVKAKDVYGELIKLDDLKKRGIISDTEFEAQKKKLLNSN